MQVGILTPPPGAARRASAATTPGASTNNRRSGAETTASAAAGRTTASRREERHTRSANASRPRRRCATAATAETWTSPRTSHTATAAGNPGPLWAIAVQSCVKPIRRQGGPTWPKGYCRGHACRRATPCSADSERTRRHARWHETWRRLGRRLLHGLRKSGRESSNGRRLL